MTEAPGAISGYAARWNSPDSFGDVLQRGAFTASLAEHRTTGTMPAMLWQHRMDEPIGVWDSIVEDDIGLAVKGRLILESPRAVEARALLAARAVNSYSIGFVTVRATPLPRGRMVHAVKLVEVSIVTRGSAPGARVASVRSAAPSASTAALAADIRRLAGHFARKS